MKGRLLFVVLVFGLAILLGFSILSYAKQNPFAHKERSRKEFTQRNSQERKEHLLRCPKDKTKISFMPQGFKFFKNSPPKINIFQKSKFNIKLLRNRVNGKPRKWEFTNRQNNNVQTYNSISYAGLDEIIEIDTDIITNTIWESGNVYHVTANVNVQALLVIEPGTIVQYSSSGALFVNNGGTLVARGTPNNLITFTSDSSTPGYGDYYSAIYIDETASVSTKITYSVIEFAYIGIVTNNIRLDSPIQNNYIQYCAFGIGEFGTEHTDIINNQIFGSYYNAIEVYMASLTGTENSSSHILIQNNTCDYYQDTGITVHGVTLGENAGVVMLVNNIVSESYYYGLNLVDGYMFGYVLNTGYYGNYLNKNWEFEETDPVIATEFPYIIGEEPLELCFLDQSCPFIDAGFGVLTQNPELICSTTSLQEHVDADTTDIGFHYPNFKTVRIRGDFDDNDVLNADDIDLLYAEINAGTNNPAYDLTNDGLVNKDDMDYMLRTLLGTEYGDANLDCKVNNVDLGLLTSNWLKSGQGWADGDFNGNGLNNFFDYAILARNWGFEGEGPAEISVQVSGVPNNLSDFIEIGVTGYTDNTSQVFLFMDGEYIGEIWDFYEKSFGIESYAFSNGLHELKVVSTDFDGFITLSENLTVNFNNTIYNVIANDQFHPDEDYKFSGFYDGTNTLEAKLTNMYDQVIWSNSYSGENVNIVILGANFGSEQFCEFTITETESGMMAMAETNSSNSDVTIDLTKKFKETDWPAGAKMVIVLPDKDVYKARKPAILACAEACENRGVNWVSLYGHNVNEENLTYLFTNPNVKYIYWCGHANSHVGANPDGPGRNQYSTVENHGVGGVARTNTGAWRRSWITWNKIRAFSWTRQTKPGAELPNNWDQIGFDLWSLGMYNQGNKKIVFIDGCWSAFNCLGYYPCGLNDMADAFGIQPGDPDQTYIGWRIETLASANPLLWNIVEHSTQGVMLFWQAMGNGDDVYNALLYTYQAGPAATMRALWGTDGLFDLCKFYENKDDNIHIYGTCLGTKLEP